MHEARVFTGDIWLNVQSYPQNGEPVIFLGWSGANAAVWNGVVPHFIADYHVIVVEARGHGRSDKPADGYTRACMARDIIGVMDALQLPAAHLVGSSFGAEVLSTVAARYPDRVLSLVCEGAYQNCFGAHGSYDTAEAEIPAKLAELRAERKQRDDARTWVFDSWEAAYAYGREGWQQHGLWNETFDALVRGGIAETADGRFAPACPRFVTEQYMEDFWLARFDATFAGVTCPVLFLPSAEDAADATTQASIAWLRGLLRVSQVVAIPGALHALCVLLQPDEFAAAVRPFLRTVA